MGSIFSMRLFDTHTHCRYSVDSDESLDNILSFARKNSLSSVAITDHYDIDMLFTEHKGCDEQVLGVGYDEICKYRAMTENDDTKIYCGIELGCAVGDFDKAMSIISSHDYDIIIGSLHGIAGMPEYYQLDYDNMTDSEIDGILEQYFKMQLKGVRLGAYDTLAHLDYPTRYIRRHGRNYDISRYFDIIDEILKQIVLDGKALEVNTSGLRDSFKTTLPGNDIIMRYRSFGGELLTIGSDAHVCTDITANFDSALKMINWLGFDYVTYFEKRKPHSIKIDI